MTVHYRVKVELPPLLSQLSIQSETVSTLCPSQSQALQDDISREFTNLKVEYQGYFNKNLQINDKIYKLI